MMTGDEAPQGEGARQVDPALRDTPLKKLSGVFRNLFVPSSGTGSNAHPPAPGGDGSRAHGPGTAPLGDASPLPPLPPPPPKASAGPSPAAPTGRAPSGPLPPTPGTRSPAGQLPALPGRPASPPRAGTDTLSLGPARQPGPAEAPPPAPEDPEVPPAMLAAESERSDKRMAFIVAYMRDPTSRPEFQDRPLVFRIVSEERSYQQQRVTRAKRALDALGSEANEARAALQLQLDEALGRQAKLFTLLKTLTGRLGKTGGTGFLGAAPPRPPDPPRPPGPGQEDG